MAKVKFYATLRHAAGVREAELQADSVNELLELLSRQYGGKLDRYLKLSIVLVNGRNVRDLKGIKTRIKPDDVVSIYPPLGGG